MDFLNRAFRIGRLFDITIQIHVLFLVWMVYRLITAGADWAHELTFVVMLFGIVLLHEFGHCFGARAVGGSAHNILLWPLGGLAYAEAPMRPWPQFVTVAAGPLVNLLFCLISGAVLLSTPIGRQILFTLNPFDPMYAADPQVWETYVQVFYRVNYLLLCFNLLPVFPLDGGQIFRTIIWPFVGLHQATITAAQLGIVGAVLLGVLGVTRQNWILIAIAFFGGMTSWQHYQAARGGLATEAFLGADYVMREKRNVRSWWSRLFRRREREDTGYTIEFPEPRPEKREDTRAERKREREEAELDRILRKVSEHGINSLSYVERQKLERITRRRQQEGHDLQHQKRD